MQMFELTKLHVSITNSLTTEETPVKPGLDANPNGVVKILTSLHDHKPYFMVLESTICAFTNKYEMKRILFCEFYKDFFLYFRESEKCYWTVKEADD